MEDIEKAIQKLIKDAVPLMESITVGVKSRNYTGDYFGRDKRHLTTTDIGAIHEYGLGRNPVRSFLNIPLKLFGEQAVQEVNDGNYTNINDMLDDLAKKFLEICDGAFDTEGYGTWDSLTKAYVKRTGRQPPILEATGNLRSSLYAKYIDTYDNIKKVSSWSYLGRRKHKLNTSKAQKTRKG